MITPQTNPRNLVSLSVQDTIKHQHLVVIDSNVADYQSLATGVISGAKVVILEPDRDGIKQITQALKSYSFSNSVSLHIVSHGSPGCLYLGNTQLNLDTLDNYQISKIGNRLSVKNFPI